MTTTLASLRAVVDVVDAVRTFEGDRMPVRRALPVANGHSCDPFLMLDHFGPVELKPGGGGIPAHPHRGFETVTVMIQGAMEHRDSFGGQAVMRPGDVQWMTAGAGLVHSEMPAEEILRAGGVVEGLQLWVNLPRAKKFATPGYQHVAAADVPEYRSADGKVTARVIAGRAGDVAGPVTTHFPVQAVFYRLAPGGQAIQQVPAGHTALVYVIAGAGQFGAAARPAGAGQVVALAANAGDVLMAVPAAADAPLDLLMLSGAPIGEPVFSYGPFVMNTKEEIIQAIHDYNSGKMGALPG